MTWAHIQLGAVGRYLQRKESEVDSNLTRGQAWRRRIALAMVLLERRRTIPLDKKLTGLSVQYGPAIVGSKVKGRPDVTISAARAVST